MKNSENNSSIWALVTVAALGYFVDVYDLVLFSVVRVPSLKSLGLSGDELLNVGVLLLNMQMAGMLVGGIVWGICGDKKGRLSVLFGSIVLYSLANIANAFVYDISSYALMRFVAGVGLAGELGAGVTLVSETMSREKRGVGTTIIATVGVLGAIVAGVVADQFDWRTSYIVGGCMGIVLLVLRIAVSESGMFKRIQSIEVPRGDMRMLFERARLVRYLCCIGAGLPIWFVVGIFVTFAPEFATAFAMPEAPTVSKAIMFCYGGLVGGDLLSGLLSQKLRSRKRVLLLFLGFTVLSSAIYLNLRNVSLAEFYICCAVLGFSAGYWAVFITTAAEQFGTNIRATVATTVPNFVRGAVVPITSCFVILKTPLGIIGSSALVGSVTAVIALISIWALSESFSHDLDYFEGAS